jgi:cytoskeleton protein RodZ
MDDFGGKLRQARERRGISLRQIAASTKIAAAALEALERNDISKLPGGIFSRAFVRSYAVEVGLDPDATVQEFLDRFNQDAPPTAEAVAASVPEAEAAFEARRRRAALGLKVMLVGVPVLIVILYFALRGRTAAQTLDAADPPRPVSPPAAAAVGR